MNCMAPKCIVSHRFGLYLFGNICSVCSQRCFGIELVRDAFTSKYRIRLIFAFPLYDTEAAACAGKQLVFIWILPGKLIYELRQQLHKSWIQHLLSRWFLVACTRKQFTEQFLRLFSNAERMHFIFYRWVISFLTITCEHTTKIFWIYSLAFNDNYVW